MKKLVIKASEWCRKKYRNSRTKPMYSAELQTSQGSKCCLGIMAAECGISDKDLLHRLTPSDLVHENNECVNKWLTPKGRNDIAAQKAMNINDMVLPDAEKIKRLRPIFRAKGWDLDWRPNE